MSRIIQELDDLISELEHFELAPPAADSLLDPKPPVQIHLTGGAKPEPMEPVEISRKRSLAETATIMDQGGSKKPRPGLNSAFDLQFEAKQEFAQMVMCACEKIYGKEACSKMDSDTLIKQMRQPKHGQAHLSINVYSMARMLDVGGKFIPIEVGDSIVRSLEGQYPNNIFENVESVPQNPNNTRGPSFLNLTLTPQFLAQIIEKIIDPENSFVGPLEKLESERDTCMIEYSQPNTHKAFHVGHMRNCAIGDCIWRLYEHIGHRTIAVNYFGDEGTHIAKCLWLLDQLVKKEGLSLDSIPAAERGNFLGEMYTRASKMVSLGTYTIFAMPTLVIAEILSTEPHPSNPGWGVVTVNFGGDKPATVVCGGSCYEKGDKIVYCPVGGLYKGKVADSKDMGGVTSSGVIMGALEMGVDLDRQKPYHKRFGFIVRKQPVPEEKAEPQEDTGGKKKKKKKKKDKKPKVKDNRILILPAAAPVGQKIIEYGRIPDLPANLLPKLDLDVEDKEYIKVMQMCTLKRQYVHPNLKLPKDAGDLETFMNNRVSDFKGVLPMLESGEPYWKGLWDKTKVWSLDCFKEIYSWLGCRFDHDFTESECSEMSQDIVDEYYKKGLLKMSDGCIGLDLGKKLGFCMLRKSDGSGLYATKDLALARKKFIEFNVDRSFYVVDDGQSLHFKQVFGVLEAMGFKQAKKCIHIPYAKVNGPGGQKMSSRDGNVILFHNLRKKLSAALDDAFISKLTLGDDQKDAIREACAVGTIRYGMLNHDVKSQISFDINKWTAVSGGDTGPYLMMQYARVKSIQRKVPPAPDAKPDFSKLKGEDTQFLLLQFSEFQNVVQRAANEGDVPNPSCLCTYLFNLSKDFSKWYTNNNIKNEPDKDLQLTKLLFCEAFATVLKQGLYLLGIRTLDQM